MGEQVKNALASLPELVHHLQHDGPVQAIEAGVDRFIGRMDVLARATDGAGWSIIGDFLKVAVPIAASLAQQFLPAPPSLQTTAAGQQVRDATDSAVRAVAACRVPEFLLCCSDASLCHGCELQPDLVLQAASCANLAIGTAVPAVQLLYANATTASATPGSQATAASALAYGCAAICATLMGPAAVAATLEGRDPAPDLLAKFCRPGKASDLGHQLAPILLWCLEQQVDVMAALRNLTYMLAHHAELETPYRLVREGPSGPALAHLAAHQFVGLCLELVRQPHSYLRAAAAAAAAGAAAAAAGAAAAAPEAAPKEAIRWLENYGTRLARAVHLLQETKPWWRQLCKLPSAVKAATAVVLIVNRLALFYGTILPALFEGLMEALADLTAQVLLLPPDGSGRQQPLAPQQQAQQLAQQQQQGQQEVVSLCLEAAAVACAGMMAALEARSLAVLEQQGAGLDALQQPDISPCLQALQSIGRLHEALAGRLQQDTTLSSGQLHTALAAAEAALRLAAWLVKNGDLLIRLPGSEHAASEAVASQAIMQLLAIASAAVRCVSATLTPAGQRTIPSLSLRIAAYSRSGSSGGNGNGSGSDSSSLRGLSPAELKALAEGVGYLAASAAKLAAADLQRAQACPATRPVADGQLYIDLASLVLLMHSLQMIGGAEEPQDSLERHTGGALVPLLISFTKIPYWKWRAGSGFVLQPSCDPQTVLRAISGNMRALAGLLAELDALPFATALRAQEALLAGLHILWQTMQKVLELLPANRRQLIFGAPGIAAAHVAQLAVNWQWSALSVVCENSTAYKAFLPAVMEWAVRSTRTETRNLALVKGLQDAWSLVEAVARRVVLQQTDGAAAATAAVHKVLTAVQQLPAPRQRKQLSTPRFWQEIQQTLLPALKELGSPTGLGRNEHPEQVLLSLALATRVYSFIQCADIRGCSEGRLRTRRCSGCGVVRYCSRMCQVYDWVGHSKVCQQLAA